MVCDEPAEGATVTRGTVVNGWAYSPAGIREVSVWLDGQRVSQAELGIGRPDVAEARPEWSGAERSGFRYHFETVPASAETAELTLVADDGEGRRAEVRRSVRAVEWTGKLDEVYGRGLRLADRHYRSYVGSPEDYDLLGATQFTLLLAAGLRETHRMVDVGCGSLRAGRLFIPYLRPGHYFGVEPNRWLVEEGIKHELGDDIVRVKRPTFRFVEDFSLSAFGVDFDFALAHSVFSHTYPDLALTGLRGIAEALAPQGKLFGTFIENFAEGEPSTGGSGWLYPGCVIYAWEEMQGLIEESGLVARRIDWIHPRQSWFVAAHPSAESEIDELSRHL
jgi:SAM-dependent methyltransferase